MYMCSLKYISINVKRRLSVRDIIYELLTMQRTLLTLIYILHNFNTCYWCTPHASYLKYFVVIHRDHSPSSIDSYSSRHKKSKKSKKVNKLCFCLLRYMLAPLSLR